MFFLVGLLKSCETDKPIENIYGNYVVSMGTSCGWCVGADSLSVTANLTHYEYNFPCNDNDYAFDTLTNIVEWNELMSEFDMKKFQSININTCNVCADGCDTWVSVQNDTVTHRISFGSENSAEIANIKPFIDKLNSIRSRYRKN